MNSKFNYKTKILRFLFFLSLLIANGPFISEGLAQNGETIDYQKASFELLTAVKNGGETENWRQMIESSTLDGLTDQLSNDQEKLAFWINVYNAYIILVLRDQPELYEDRRNFFKAPRIPVAGELLSFEQIEHSIIRRSQSPLGLGYIMKIFRPKWERKLRVDNRDYRVHFALNCGAKSCPSVDIYSPDKLNEQFDAQAISFLNKTSSFNMDNDTWIVTALFSWFRGDFGGKKGMKKILKSYNITKSTDINFEYGDYDWTLDLDNYTN